MDELIDQVVLPGDIIGTVTGEKKIRLGPGLMQNEDAIMATKAGLLRYKADRYWVENTQKRVRNIQRAIERRQLSIVSTGFCLLVFHLPLPLSNIIDRSKSLFLQWMIWWLALYRIR